MTEQPTAAVALAGATTATTTTTETPTAGTFDWKGSLGDSGAAFLPLVQTKGWKSPADALQSYQELESTLGRDKVVVPGANAKPEDWDKVYAKLGRPEKPDGYGLKPLEGMPEGLYDQKSAAWFASVAHKAGLNPSQARLLHDEFAKLQVEGHNAKINAVRQAGEQGEAALRSEWGPDYDVRVQTAQRAAKAIGIDAPTLDKIETALGYAGLMKFFAGVGAKMGEDVAVGRGGGAANPATQEGAMAEIGRIYAEAAKDPGHAYHKPTTPEGQALAKRMMDLHAIAYPGNIAA